MSVCFGNLYMCPSKPFSFVHCYAQGTVYVWADIIGLWGFGVWMTMYVFHQFFRSIPGTCACVSCNLRELLRGEFLWSFKVVYITSYPITISQSELNKCVPSGMALSHLRWSSSRERLRNRKMSLCHHPCSSPHLCHLPPPHLFYSLSIQSPLQSQHSPPSLLRTSLPLLLWPLPLRQSPRPSSQTASQNLSKLHQLHRHPSGHPSNQHHSHHQPALWRPAGKRAAVTC